MNQHSGSNDPRARQKPGAIFFMLGIFLLVSVAIHSQSNPPTPKPDPQDSFQCTKIPTQVDGIDYDKTMKCETRDAICYIIEGFAMSCVPKIPITESGSQ